MEKRGKSKKSKKMLNEDYEEKIAHSDMEHTKKRY